MRDFIGAPPSVPPFEPRATSPDSEAVGVGDQGGYNLARRPRWLAGATVPVEGDPVGLSLLGVLSDIFDVLLGTYSAKGRPEQINISPAEGNASFTSHTRYHITAIKGAIGTAGSVIAIRIGTEIVERIYSPNGGPFAVPAALWIDRGQTVSAVDTTAAAVDFSCILIASEAD